MRVPAFPQPLIPVPMLRRAEALPLATFSAPDVLRQTLFETASPLSLTTSVVPTPLVALAPPAPATPSALHTALLAYVARTQTQAPPPSVIARPPSVPPASGTVVAPSLTPSLLPATELDVLQTILRAPSEISRTDSLRQTTVIGLLRALVGKDGALPLSGLATRAGPTPAAALDHAAAGPAMPAPAAAPIAVAAPRTSVIALASGDLLLRLQQPLQADGVARPPLQAELLLHPTLIRHAPLLAAALAASDWLPELELPTLHLASGPLPQWLGFQVMVSPAALWPVMVCVASGHLHLPRVASDLDDADDIHAAEHAEDEVDAQDDADSDDADDEPAEREEPPPAFEIDESASLPEDGPLTLGERIAFWIAVQRLRLAFR